MTPIPLPTISELQLLLAKAAAERREWLVQATAAHERVERYQRLLAAADRRTS